MRKPFTIIALLFTLSLWSQQENMYTQFMYNKLSLNPAYAGNERFASLTAVVRDQWNGFVGAPETQVLSLNLPGNGTRSGFGAHIKRNTIGVTSLIKVAGDYAYKIPLQGGTLSLGLEGSLSSFTIDFADEKIFATQGIANDPTIPQEKQGINLFNVGTGVYYNTEEFYVGLSVPGLIKNKFDFDSNDRISRSVRHLFLMGGASFDVNPDGFISVQSLLKFAENSPFDADLGISYTAFERYTAGVNYRFGGAEGDIGESIDVLFSFRITNQFLLGLSHDFTLSQIKDFDNGSIEIIGHYSFGKETRPEVKVINPRFF